MITLLIKGSLVEPAGHEDDLPLEFIMKHIAGCLAGTSGGIDSRLLLLKAMTASGKSTTIPPVLHTEFILKLGKYCQWGGNERRRVLCTQPRIITTVSIPHQIVAGGYYHKFVMGKDIGYKTKVATEMPIERGVLFVVLQVLTQELKTSTDEAIIARYSFIVIDEAHERSVDMDLTLSLLKRFVARNAGNPACPYVIIMSATFEPERYAKYFGGGMIAVVKGFTYPVEERWPTEGYGNYLEAAAATVKEILKADPEGDILVFMPGNKQGTAMRMAIEGSPEGKGVEFLSLNREAIVTFSLDYRRLNAVEDPKKKRRRRVIVSTSVAETGITLPALKYVVDPGWAKTIEYNPWFNVSGLLEKPAAQSQIQQRRGRVGREGPGIFYPLYTKEVYDSLLPIQLPEVIKEDPTLLVLNSINLAAQAGGGEPQLDLLDNPSGVSYNRALHKLVTLGFVQRESLEFTAIGELAAKMATVTSVENVKMILGGFAWKACVLDLITIAAFSEATALDPRKCGFSEWCQLINIAFEIRGKDVDSYYLYKLLFADEAFDALVVYSAFMRQFEKSNYDVEEQRKWCEKMGVTWEAIIMAVEQREGIIDTMIKSGINPFYRYDFALTRVFAGSLQDATGNDVVIALKQAIWEGYRNNVATWNGSAYETTEGLAFHWMFYGPYRKEWAMYKEKEPVIPKRLVYGRIQLKYNAMKLTYEPSVDRVSVMDGYVYWPDLNLAEV